MNSGVKSLSFIPFRLEQLRQNLDTLEQGVSAFKNRPYSTRLARGLSQIRSSVVSEFTALAVLWESVQEPRQKEESALSTTNTKLKRLKAVFQAQVGRWEYCIEVCDPLLHEHGFSTTTPDLNCASADSSWSSPSSSSSWLVTTSRHPTPSTAQRFKPISQKDLTAIQKERNLQKSLLDYQLDAFQDLAWQLSSLNTSIMPGIHQRVHSKDSKVDGLLVLKDNTRRDNTVSSGDACTTLVLARQTQPMSRLYVFGAFGGAAGMLMAGPVGAAVGLKAGVCVKVMIGVMSVAITAIGIYRTGHTQPYPSNPLNQPKATDSELNRNQPKLNDSGS